MCLGVLGFNYLISVLYGAAEPLYGAPYQVYIMVMIMMIRQAPHNLVDCVSTGHELNLANVVSATLVRLSIELYLVTSA